MPYIDPALLLPTRPLHWISILHYIVLLGSLFILITSGDKAKMIFIFILAGEALFTGADLYVDRVYILRFFIFMLRVLMVGIPVLLAGISPTQQTRGAAGFTALMAAPILVVTFFTCQLGPFGDPRIISWC